MYIVLLLMIRAFNLQQRTQLARIKIFHISRSATDYAITLNIVNYHAINANITIYAHLTRTHIKRFPLRLIPGAYLHKSGSYT